VNSWKAILATMVIFGTGVVTGGLLVFKVISSKPPKSHLGGGAAKPALMTPGNMRIEFLRRVERDLDVSAQQRDQIDKILTASQERTKKLMEPVTPKLREEMQATRDAVRDVLTSDQRQRFDELVKTQQRPREPKRQSIKPPKPALEATNSAP
jgi:Spy/CpxP family protein refolding chaperone